MLTPPAVPTWRDQDLSRKMADLLSVIGSVFLLIFGTSSFRAGLPIYGVALYVFAAATLLNLFVFKTWHNWRLYRSVVLVIFSSLMIFLVLSGGENGTGILWCYSYPLLTFPLFGHRLGKWLIGGGMAGAILVMYMPELVGANYSYPMEFKHRFAGSLVFVSLMAYILEYARARADERTQVAMDLLRHHANRDELTGTYNRRGIKQKVQLELHRVGRDHTEMSVVLCDIDYFKKINDNHGHDLGDQALKEVARILMETVRITDSVGRWGGEEFLILLPNTSLIKGYQLIERVRKRIAQEPLIFGELSLNISISCGICSTRFSSQFDDLIRAADTSLYEAKADGRNCTRPVLAKAS